MFCLAQYTELRSILSVLEKKKQQGVKTVKSLNCVWRGNKYTLKEFLDVDGSKRHSLVLSKLQWPLK